MSDSFVDRNIVCRERTCGKTFVFTAGEQRFYHDRNYTPPVRCKECRDRRKAAQQDGKQAVENIFMTAAGFPTQSVEGRKGAKPVEVQHRRPFGSRKQKRQSHGDYDYDD